jgi:hypothetical protein
MLWCEQLMETRDGREKWLEATGLLQYSIV